MYRYITLYIKYKTLTKFFRHPQRVAASLSIIQLRNSGDIPVQKKAAAGVHAIRLGDSDEVEECYLLTGGTDLGTGTDPASEIEMNGKKVALNRLRIAGRGTRGTKR